MADRVDPDAERQNQSGSHANERPPGADGADVVAGLRAAAPEAAARPLASPGPDGGRRRGGGLRRRDVRDAAIDARVARATQRELLRGVPVRRRVRERSPGARGAGAPARGDSRRGRRAHPGGRGRHARRARAGRARHRTAGVHPRAARADAERSLPPPRPLDRRRGTRTRCW